MPMIDDLEHFLRCATRLEADAADGYAQLATIMADSGNSEVAALFSKFGEFSNLHYEEMLQHQRNELGHCLAASDDSDITWPDGHSPEDPLEVADLSDLSARQAIEMALETERRACDFYSAVAGQTRSARVQELAQEFAEEEAEHVEHLQRWLERL